MCLSGWAMFKLINTNFLTLVCLCKQLRHVSRLNVNGRYTYEDWVFIGDLLFLISHIMWTANGCCSGDTLAHSFPDAATDGPQRKLNAFALLFMLKMKTSALKRPAVAFYFAETVASFVAKRASRDSWHRTVLRCGRNVMVFFERKWKETRCERCFIISAVIVTRLFITRWYTTRTVRPD